MVWDKLTDREKEALIRTAAAIQVNADWLYKLIDFESLWNPFARNPYSGARGLIQFIDSTARRMGYLDADDLVEKNPTIEQQLLNPVYHYLREFRPFPTEQSLTMAVFYPAYRSIDMKTPFPDSVVAVNPGINTPLDYIKKVFGDDWIPSASVAVLVVAGAVLFLTMLFQKGA
jgi:hypothetical protein